MRGKKTHMTSRTRVAAFCCVLLLGLVSMTGLAAHTPVDANRLCSATVYASGDTGAYGEDIATANVQVDLYRVADAYKVSGYDTLRYVTTGAFASFTIPEQSNKDDWDALAAAAGEIVRTQLDTLTPEASAPAGTAMSGLPAGIYLAIAHGSDLSDYFTTIKNEAGDQVLVSIARSARYEYYFEPELVAVPTKAPDADGNIGTANGGEWLYNVDVVMKSSREQRFGDLEIIKTLRTYLKSESAMFVFNVQLTIDGVKQPAKTYSLSFKDAEQRSLLIKDLPASALVTVTEIYDGSTYTLISDQAVNTVIVADDTVSVEFINDYDDDGHGGHGVENHFTLGEDGWSWEQRPDSNGN